MSDTLTVTEMSGSHRAPGAPKKIARSKGGMPPWRYWGLKISVGLAILLTWEAVVTLWAPNYVARPSRIIVKFPEVLTSAEFWIAAADTGVAVVLGIAIALVLGSILGLIIGRSKKVDDLSRFYINALYSLPIISLLPLLTLWFGYTGLTRLILIVIACGLPIVFNVAEGARSVQGNFLEVCKAFRISETSTLFEVVMPAAMPYVIAGVNLAIGRALIGAVVAEFLAAINGLGYFVLFNSRSFQQDKAMVAVLMLSLLGILAHALTRLLTRKLIPWYQANR